MDITDFLRYAAALAFVLALILALAWVMRRTGLDGRFGGSATAFGKKSERRLAVIETLMLDNRRRLILFRCDDRDHLVLLGQTSETVIDASQGVPSRKDDEGSVTGTTATGLSGSDLRAVRHS